MTIDNVGQHNNNRPNIAETRVQDMQASVPPTERLSIYGVSTSLGGSVVQVNRQTVNSIKNHFEKIR